MVLSHPYDVATIIREIKKLRLLHNPIASPGNRVCIIYNERACIQSNTGALMFFRPFWIPGFAQISYIIGVCGGPVAVIDPIRDVDGYITVAHEEGIQIMAVMDTHIHADCTSSNDVGQRG